MEVKITWTNIIPEPPCYFFYYMYIESHRSKIISIERDRAGQFLYNMHEENFHIQPIFRNQNKILQWFDDILGINKIHASQ